MKKFLTSLTSAFFITCMMIFYGCKKDAENPPVTAPAISTADVSTIATTSAETGGNVTSTGSAEVISRGVCWNTVHNPTVADNKTTDGNGSGTFTSSIAGLTPNTAYYVRAYATYSKGTIYGSEISFSTLSVVTTTAIVNISSTSVVVTGNVFYEQNGDHLIGSGVCWSTSPNPTTDDSKTTNATFSGIFTSNLEGLTQGTTYFVRAYALYDNGPANYGNELSFTTYLPQSTGTQKADFPGGKRYRAAGFSIGIKVYMGLGYDDNDGTRNDFWEWDQATDVWTKKADYPGNSTGVVVSFSIGTKCYVGTEFANEFWEYDSETNTWTQKASLPGTPSRNVAAGFSIGTNGYLGTGGAGASYLKDFWEWDQATNVWTQKANFGGMARGGAVGFSIGNKGYIGTGFGAESVSYKDFWEWDKETDTWTEKADFEGAARAFAVGFSTGTKAYIGNGYNVAISFKDYWEWDQGTDQWIRKADFAAGARIWAVGVAIGNKGYIGTGIGGSWGPGIGNGFLNDFWEYDSGLK